jgi:ACS family hexuronate transporter-like MFS transporter
VVFFVGKLMTDGIWWFYLFWLPDYLVKQFHMPIHDTMWPTFIVYRRGHHRQRLWRQHPNDPHETWHAGVPSRMTAMFMIALCPLAVLSTQYFGDVSHFGDMAKVYAVAVICIGAAAHQAWSANLFTTVSDMFPKTAVGSVTGIGAMAGGLGGVIVQLIAGTLTDTYKATPSNGLHDHVCHLRLELFDCVGRHETARAPPQADHRHLKLSLKKKSPLKFQLQRAFVFEGIIKWTSRRIRRPRLFPRQ